jgi:hypothetical protein
LLAGALFFTTLQSAYAQDGEAETATVRCQQTPQGERQLAPGDVLA